MRIALVPCTAFLLVASALPAADLVAQVSVWPDGGSATAPENTSGNTVDFTVENTGSDDWFLLSCSRTGAVTSCSPSQNQVFISAGSWVNVTVTYSTGPAGAGTVTLTAQGSEIGGSDDGWYDVTVQPPPGAPVVESWAYEDPAKKQNYSLCAVACYALTYAQSTVPYFSLDTPRNVTLAYNSDRANPRPFVHVDVMKNASYPEAPQKFQLQVKINSSLVTFVNGEQTLNFQYVNDATFHRIGGQFDASGYATGVYPMDILVSAVYSGGVGTTTISTVFVQVNEAGSPFGRGWTVAGVQRAYPQGDGSVLITEGDGNALYFKWNGSVYESPIGEFSRLSRAGSNWRRDYPDSTIVLFNPSGRMLWVSDRFVTSNLDYDANGRLWRVRDPRDWGPVLSYDAAGHLSSVSDQLGRVTYVTVQSDGRLTGITDPDNLSTTFGYDTQLRLNTVTDRHGYTTTIGYDANSWKLASITAPPGLVSPVMTYGAWHTKGVPYVLTSGTPYANGQRDTISGTVTDPEGHVTRHAWLNRYWQAQTIALPAGITISPRYTAQNQLRSLTQPLGGIDSIGYDASGLPTYAKLAGTTATNLRYGSGWGVADSLWGDQQPGERRFLGPAGRVDSARVGATGPLTGYLTRYYYETDGRVQIVRDPAYHDVSYQHLGTNGNLSQVTLPGNRTTTYGYDGYGRVTSIAQTGMPTRTIQYDQLNRVTYVYDGVNPNPTRYQYDLPYDANNYIAVRVTDPKGQVYDEVRNKLGWVTFRKDPVGRLEQYEYDRDGLLTRYTNRRGQAVQYGYDALHRPTSKSGITLPTFSFTYSPDSRVITASSGATWSETSYLNVRGQPDSVRTHLAPGDYWVRYGYTTAGRVDSVWGAGGPGVSFLGRKYVYDTPSGLLTAIRLNGAATTIGPNGEGLARSTTFPGGAIDTAGFMSLHGPGLLGAWASYGDSVGRAIRYDAQGRLRMQLNERGHRGHLYGFDGLGRLAVDTTVTATNPRLCDGLDPDYGAYCPWFSQDWTVQQPVTPLSYDPAGNRTDNGGLYATGNRIQHFGTCDYSSDVDGNILWRDCKPGRVDLTWNAENRPTRLAAQGQNAVDVGYDAFGRLIEKNAGAGGHSYFLWAGEDLLAELDGGGQKVAEYSYYPGQDRLHAVLVGPTVYYGHTDGVENVMALTDQGQALRRTYAYDAWGQLAGGGDYGGLNGTDRARFKGALWLGPEVDFYYMRNRWYEPKTGRFLSEDPIGLAGGINPYTYAGNDPVNGSDPTGLTGDCDTYVTGYGHWQGGVFIMVWKLFSTIICRDRRIGDQGPGGSQAGGQSQKPAACIALGSPLLGTYPVSSPWGIPRDVGTNPHRGADYAAPVGTPVLAVLPGIVYQAGPQASAGNRVGVQHSGGLFSRYLHMSEIWVHTGDTVDLGSVLGLSGSTGVATGPNLHFELFRDFRNTLNPAGCVQ